MTITEHFEENKIAYKEVGKDLYDIEGFGLILYADFSKKKSIYRSYDDGEETYIYLNLFETKEELINSGIKYVAFWFGESYNYVDIEDEKLTIKHLSSIGYSQPMELDFDYVQLAVHTEAELLSGVGLPKDWVARAKFLGHKSLGIADFNTLSYTLNMQKECDAVGIKPIFGYSTKLTTGVISVADRGDISDPLKTANIKLYAKDAEGFASLLRIQKAVMVDLNEGEEYGLPKGYLMMEELMAHSKGLILVMGATSTDWLVFNSKATDELKERFKDNIYYQLDVNEYKANRIDIVKLKAAKMYFDTPMLNEIPPALIADSYYPIKYMSQDKVTVNKIALRAHAGSGKDRTIYDADSRHHSDEQWYKSIDEHYEVFKTVFESIDPYDILKEAALNTHKIADACEYRYTLDKNYMPEYELTDEEKEKWGDSMSMFDGLLEEGLMKKAPADKIDLYRERLEMEKYVIKSTNNVDYMLNQYDVVKWAEENGIVVGAGRGSASGSLVLYLLNVTKVDPIRFSLLFERFLLPERAGLYDAHVTKISEEVDDAEEVVEIEFEDGRKVVLDIDSQILIDGEDSTLYADELKDGMKILFDNIDNLFKIK